MYYGHDDDNIRIIAIISFIMIIIIIFIVIKIVDNNQYNNGICSCGGTYEFKQAIGHQATTEYLYICDKCGRAIEISNYYPPK